MTGCVCVESGAWGGLHILEKLYVMIILIIYLYFYIQIFILAYNVTKIKLKPKGCTDNTQATILAIPAF